MIAIKKVDLPIPNIRKYLEGQKRKTLHEIEDLSAEDPFSNAERQTDNAERATEASEQEGHIRAEVLKRKVELTLAKIRKALSRIGMGKYGHCEKCGMLIDKARLKANPLAYLCFDCERAKER